MAKPQRGLPESFSLNIPEDEPVRIGDFLDESPLTLPRAKELSSPPRTERYETRPISYQNPVQQFRPEIVGDREPVLEKHVVRPNQNASKHNVGIRYQLNLTHSSKVMLEDLVQHVSNYGPETNTKVSEVFQGIITLLYNAKDELDLASIPKRGAWGSVTAKNFPVALSHAFEKAILLSAKKRGEL